MSFAPTLWVLGKLVPSLDDQFRTLKQDARVQLSLWRRRLTCVPVCSSCRLRLNTLVEPVLVGLAQMPLAHNRCDHLSTLKQTVVVHSNKLIAPQKILFETSAFFCPSTSCRKTTHFFLSVLALPSRVKTVCFSFVVHRTGGSPIHGRWFSG